MTKQSKWALGVVAFVTTATCARTIGWYEMKDQYEKKLTVLQERIVKLTENNASLDKYYKLGLKREVERNASDQRGEEFTSYSKGFKDALKEYRACKHGSRDDCRHVMFIATDNSSKYDVLYDSDGNYNQGAFTLFERMADAELEKNKVQ